MGIVYTADVFCDNPECPMWTHGYTSVLVLPKGEARENAAKVDKWVHYKGNDFCPSCWKKLQTKPKDRP